MQSNLNFDSMCVPLRWRKVNFRGSIFSKMKLTGQMSWFGGPKDQGVGPHEGLALVSDHDLNNPAFASLFLPEQPPGTTGLARRLNPDEFYIACRWQYKVTPPSLLRHSMMRVTNPRTGKSVLARPVDWGPNDDTGRIADLSPGVLDALELTTDDTVSVELVVAQLAAAA